MQIYPDSFRYNHWSELRDGHVGSRKVDLPTDLSAECLVLRGDRSVGRAQLITDLLVNVKYTTNKLSL